jgi:hypothetical protein
VEAVPALGFFPRKADKLDPGAEGVGLRAVLVPGIERTFEARAAPNDRAVNGPQARQIGFALDGVESATAREARPPMFSETKGIGRGKGPVATFWQTWLPRCPPMWQAFLAFVAWGRGSYPRDPKDPSNCLKAPALAWPLGILTAF